MKWPSTDSRAAIDTRPNDTPANFNSSTQLSHYLVNMMLEHKDQSRKTTNTLFGLGSLTAIPGENDSTRWSFRRKPRRPDDRRT